MKLFNLNIILFALVISLVLGIADTVFDYLYHFKGANSFSWYLVNGITIQEVLWRGLFVIISLLLGFAVSSIYNNKMESEAILKNIFNNTLPISITDNNYEIIMANDSYFDFFGGSTGAKCYQARPGKKCKGDECPVVVIKNGKEKVYTCEITKKGPDNESRTFVVTATPFVDDKGNQIGVIESFQNITERKQLELKNEQLMVKMKEALEEVKTLSGFLPICASCKKIRDDKGYWNQIESYLKEHSGAEFSHSICPDCAKTLYPDFIKPKRDGKTDSN